MNETCTAVIHGAPVTKKNSARILRNPKTGIPFIAPSAKYKQYEKEALAQLRRPTAPIRTACNVKCVYYMPTRRRVDLANLLEATMDILVRAGLLEDDNSGVAAMHDGSCVHLDRAQPRVEITITPLEGSEP